MITCNLDPTLVQITSPRRSGPLRIEAFTLLSHALQAFARRKIFTVLPLQVLQRFNHLIGPQLIHIAERPAEEWRKTNAEHRADIAVARAADHAFIQTTCGFIEHHHYATLRDDGRL
ncbi:hypothetical protein D3C72_1431510 [compost metagenome]